MNVATQRNESCQDRPSLTFQAVAGRYIVGQMPEWQDIKLLAIWRSSLRRIYPRNSGKLLASVDTEDVVVILR